jgi:hypothetical protein
MFSFEEPFVSVLPFLLLFCLTSGGTITTDSGKVNGDSRNWRSESEAISSSDDKESELKEFSSSGSSCTF